MRVLSDWRLRGLLGLSLVAGGLGWMNQSHLPDTSSFSTLISKVTPASLQGFFGRSPAPMTAMENYGRIPLHFEPNVGQAHPDVKYLARGAGYALLLTPDEAVFHLSRPLTREAETRSNPALMPAMESTVLRAQLVGANKHAAIHGEAALPGHSNYFIGNKPEDWHTGVANFSRVRYEAIYPGIDLVYYGNQQQLEYDFVVQPGANPDVIRMAYQGASKLHLDAQGNLLAETALGPVVQQKPVVYQTIAGIRHAVAGEFSLHKEQVSFELGDYDRSQPLVIDPVLVYSSYLGGGSLNSFSAASIAVTPTGAAYVTGYTNSSTFPVSVSPYQQFKQSTISGFVTRIAPDGSGFDYSTYLSGSSSSRALAIAVDASGNAYVAGTTQAADFPTITDSYQTTTSHSLGNGFLTKLAADGKSLLFSTYLGGATGSPASGEALNAISSVALDGSGAAWVTGTTYSGNFPLLNALPGGHGSSGVNKTGFLTHFSADGKTLQSSTYIGGSGSDLPTAVALAAGDVFLTGSTTSTNFPKTDSSQLNGTGSGSASDAFVVRLGSDGQTLRYAGYLGGNGDDQAYGIAADSSGNAYVAGSTRSTDFTATPAPKTDSNSTAFLTFFNSAGSKGFSTYIGTQGSANAVALDSTGTVYVAGQMAAAFPLLDPVRNADNAPADSGNAFISQFRISDQTLLFSTDLGGSNTDEGINSIALDAADALYVTGNTLSSNFPTLANDSSSGNYSATFARSGFVSKIARGPAMILSIFPGTVALGANSTLTWDSPDADSCTWDDEASPVASAGTRTVSEPTAGDYVYTLRCSNSDGVMTRNATLHVVPPPIVTFTLTPSTIVVGQTTTLNWSSTYATRGCFLSGDNTGNVAIPTTGSLVSSPATTVETTDLKVSCDGAGSTTATDVIRTLTVVEAPRITALTQTPSSNPLLVGGHVTYAWEAEYASHCTATGIPGTLPVSGSADVTVSAAGTQSLTLTCTGPTGATTSSSKTTVALDPAVPPSVTFTTDSNSIPLYQGTTLRWSASNAVACVASGSWSALPAGAGSLSGTRAVIPPALGVHNYTLTCTGAAPLAGPALQSSHTVSITSTTPPAPVLQFTATPSTIPLGESSRLNWSSTNTDSNACVASGNPAWTGSRAASGVRTLTPTAEGTLTLTLTCTGAGGSDDETLTVTVTPRASTGGGSTGGDSGGPLDLPLLLGISLLGLALQRRQQRAH